LGLAEKTITVLTSDHGDMMSGHGLLGKRLMFEQSASVPYLIRVPGQRPLRCSNSVSHIDFLPTVLDLLGKKQDEQCNGQSRANLVRGERAASESVFLEWSRSRPKRLSKDTELAAKQDVERALFESTRAIVSPDGWKLCLRDKDKSELYNMREDPDERRNLYYTGAQSEIIAKLTGEIRRWQERTGDTLKI
jgi:arylsulfatase A-like enzyme